MTSVGKGGRGLIAAGTWLIVSPRQRRTALGERRVCTRERRVCRDRKGRCALAGLRRPAPRTAHVSARMITRVDGDGEVHIDAPLFQTVVRRLGAPTRRTTVCASFGWWGRSTFGLGRTCFWLGAFYFWLGPFFVAGLLFGASGAFRGLWGARGGASGARAGQRLRSFFFVVVVANHPMSPVVASKPSKP